MSVLENYKAMKPYSGKAVNDFIDSLTTEEIWQVLELCLKQEGELISKSWSETNSRPNPGGWI
ncbi:MAG: hypothetical protein KAS32_21370 [Candidatus Peribacteraceae bacterium]|nr:hypothetical protein [Candidatus Peribacteraceae bacterium]